MDHQPFDIGLSKVEMGLRMLNIIYKPGYDGISLDIQ